MGQRSVLTKRTCVAGIKHDLVVLRQENYSSILGGSVVTRWCQACGGVVIDLDVDGRTMPGEIAKMVFPKLALDKK